jgi:hypothetical protein
MNIEVLTTKKKLSKSIVKQLESANLNDIEYFNSMPTIGYYVRGLGGVFPPRVAIFEGLNGWKIIGLRDWEARCDDRIECSARDIGKRGTSVKYINDAKKYIDSYNKMKEECLKNHLIL